MKKLAIWFISAIITVMGISNPAIADQITLPLDKLPSNAQIQDVITVYPLKIGNANDKSIIKITSKGIAYKNKSSSYPRLEKMEIQINGETIYKEDIHPQFHLVYDNDKNYDTYFLSSSSDSLVFAAYEVIKGSNHDYIAYNILNTNDEDGGYYEYTLIDIRHNHGKFEAIKVNENLLVSNADKPFTNPKLDDHTYKLVEDKYIISSIGLTFKAKAYYEVVSNTIQLADKEFELSDVTPNKEKLQKSPLVTLYNKPNTQSASTSMKLSENTQIKFIGIRYMGINEASEYIVHAIIDGKDGWITGSDFREIN